MPENVPNWRLRMLIWIPVIFVSVYVILCVVVYAIQDRMVYHPTTVPGATPADWGMSYEDVHFEASDNVTLHGWFITGAANAPVILICHGNAGNIADREPLLKLLHELGINVFIFDYRGYGNSDGKPSEEGTVLDASAAWAELTKNRHIASERIVIFGRSLGGGVATYLASTVDAAGLILMSTFTALPDVGQKQYPYLPIRMLAKYKYPNIEHVKTITVPKLILHSRQDELIPFSHGEALFEAAKSPKQFVSLEGGHNDAIVISRTEMKHAIKSYMDNLFP